MNNIKYVIQARAGSSRLPAKIFLSIAGTTVLGFLIDRLISSNISREDIIIATTESSIDDMVENYSNDLGVFCVRGDEINVLQRYQKVAEITDASDIVRLTSDNPLPDIDLLQHCVKYHLASDVDLTSTRLIEPDGNIKRFTPKGSTVDIVRCSALKNINSNSCTPFEKEHVIPYFYKYNSFKIVEDYKMNRPSLSIDTLEDYAKVKGYIESQL